MAHSATDVVSNLPAQIIEVLRDQRMSFTQLSTYYSIKYRSPLNERLKGANVTNIKEYLEGLSNIFEVQGQFVKARQKGTAESGNSDSQGIATIRYAHISKGIQNILNETHSKSLAIADLEATFKIKFGVSLGSVIGMSTIEYLQRKANVFDIEGDVVHLQSAFHKDTESKVDQEKESKINPEKAKDVFTSTPVPKSKGGLSPIAEEADSEKPSKARQAWADLPVIPDASETCPKLSKGSEQRTNQPKQKALDGLLSSLRSLAPTDPSPGEVQTKAKSDSKSESKKETPDKNEKKSDNLPLFAVDELVRIFEENSEGPIMHSSVLCSLFMQQLGASVTEISGKKPMELFRQHPESFIWLSSGNVALAKYREDKAVQHELKLLDDQPKCVRVKAAAAEAALPVPEKVTEEDVVNYMLGLLKENEDRDSIYISALCGRFMQRFRKPVTEIVGCKPTDFLKKYKDIFYLEKGGHVKLVNSEVEELPACPAQKDTEKVLHGEKAGSDPQNDPVTVPPPARPWRRGAPDADKENFGATSATDQHGEKQQQQDVSRQASTRVDPEVQQKIDDFCNRLRKQLFFRVTEVTSGAPIQPSLSVQGRAAHIPVTVKVTNLPKEIEAQWLPQLLSGLEQVLNLKFNIEVDGVAVEGDAVHCRLRNVSFGLIVSLAVV